MPDAEIESIQSDETPTMGVKEGSIIERVDQLERHTELLERLARDTRSGVKVTIALSASAIELSFVGIVLQLLPAQDELARLTLIIISAIVIIGITFAAHKKFHYYSPQS